MMIQAIDGCLTAVLHIEELCLLSRALRYYRDERACLTSVDEDDLNVEHLENALSLAAYACQANTDHFTDAPVEWSAFAHHIQPREEKVSK